MKLRAFVGAVSLVLGLFGGAASAAVSLEAGMARPLVPVERKGPAVGHVRVSLVGGTPPAAAQRPPINVCLAIDRSGSMAGEKLAQARLGAIAALGRLAPGDIVSVVAYDDVVRVAVPATRASNRAEIERSIRRLEPGGGTALFAGVVKCAAEVRKLAGKDRVNRIILLSDGQANVGPSTPAELGALGARLMEEGISVATVGLGTEYNEDLMSELALKSDGGHVFVQNPRELATFFDAELAAVTSVVARDVLVQTTFAPGMKPLRVLGRPGDIDGRVVRVPFGKVYGRRQHFFVIEVEMETARTPGEQAVATVDVDYRDLVEAAARKLTRGVTVKTSSDAQLIARNANKAIAAELAMLDADAAAARAIELIDRGDVAAAQDLLAKNTASVEAAARDTGDLRLMEKAQNAREQQLRVQRRPKASDVRKSIKQGVYDDALKGLKL